jgi:hypothetical protein
MVCIQRPFHCHCAFYTIPYPPLSLLITHSHCVLLACLHFMFSHLNHSTPCIQFLLSIFSHLHPAPFKPNINNVSIIDTEHDNGHTLSQPQPVSTPSHCLLTFTSSPPQPNSPTNASTTQPCTHSCPPFRHVWDLPSQIQQCCSESGQHRPQWHGTPWGDGVLNCQTKTPLSPCRQKNTSTSSTSYPSITTTHPLAHPPASLPLTSTVGWGVLLRIDPSRVTQAHHHFPSCRSLVGTRGGGF